MLHQRDLRSHDAAGLDADRIVHRNRPGNILDKADSQLDIGLLQGFVSFCKGRVDLCLDVLRLVDESHQFPQEDVPLLVHQFIALTGQRKGVLR